MKKIILSLALLLSARTSLAVLTTDGAYILDKKHASIRFSVSHLGISNVMGQFRIFDGQFVFESNGASSVSFEIDASSVDTNQSQRDDHIRSEDFFDVSNFPKITFKADRFTYDEEGDPKTITGDLSFHGSTKEMTFDVKAVGAGEVRGKFHAGYQATGKLSRSAFGVDSLPAVVGDEIEITVNLEIVRQ